MIRLQPTLEIPEINCPNCHSKLSAQRFLIPGMRNLAEYFCQNCGGDFYGDLPSGQALFTPILLDKKSGAIFDDYNVAWFSGSLANSYQHRKDEHLRFETRKFSEVKDKVILLNCLDVLYGHSLLKLLNAQYYLDQKPDYSLIIIAPPFLEWMIPDGTAEAWIVDLPLERGSEWNDWLAQEIAQKIEDFTEVFLSVAFSHPHPQDFDIERFTRVKPFALEKFAGLQNNPVITFIWREDRLWENETAVKSNSLNKIKRSFGFSENRIDEQTRKIVLFAEALRGAFPELDFAVAGLGTNGSFPAWMKDLRLNELNAEREREWCERYAKSQIVVGVHGSNMLLPSAHAGGVIELLDENRQGNFLQDILFRETDAREILFRYRFVPHSTSPENLADIASILLRFDEFRKLMSLEFSRHQENYDFEKRRSKQKGENSGVRD